MRSETGKSEASHSRQGSHIPPPHHESHALVDLIRINLTRSERKFTQTLRLFAERKCCLQSSLLRSQVLQVMCHLRPERYVQLLSKSFLSPSVTGFLGHNITTSC